MIVYVVNATLVSMKWRWNWFSFQRFHSLPQNFMLDCQCSETHGLRRGFEMMCVTRRSKMWGLEPNLPQGRPPRSRWTNLARKSRKPVSQVQVRWHASTLKKQFSPTCTQVIVPSIFLPTFREEDYPQSQSFLRILLRSSSHLGSKRRWRTSLRKLVI